MIERFIFKALQQGVEAMQREPALLERFFLEQKKLAKEEVAAISLYFKNKPPSIIHNYARGDSPFPLYAIILAMETEDTRVLGDEGDMIGEIPDDVYAEMLEAGDPIPLGGLDPDNPDSGKDELVSIYKAQYVVLTMTEHPDVTRYYYELCKLFLTRARPFLKRCAAQGGAQLLDTHFSGGDLQPDARYIPAHMFARQFTIETQRAERIVGPDVQRAFRLEGLHLDDTSGAGNFTVEGVQALITAITTEELDG